MLRMLRRERFESKLFDSREWDKGSFLCCHLHLACLQLWIIASPLVSRRCFKASGNTALDYENSIVLISKKP